MGMRYEQRRPPEQVALSQEEIAKLAQEAGTYPVLVCALLGRGFDKKQIRDLLTAEFPGDVIMNTSLEGSVKAADRIIDALKKNQRIGVFADYDCDGVTSGFVMSYGLFALKKALKSHSLIHLHYPQRADGYGISTAYCEAAKGKLDLVITVDNGISAREQEAVLKEYGVDLIVTDHHEPNPKTLPSGSIIVDPCYSDLPRSYLAGVAVAYNVVMTAAKKIGITLNRGVFLPAVMLGTISDCMPMSYENACYIKAGLEFLNRNDKCTKFYLDAFYDSYNKKVKLPPVITPKDISFTVAPKINSASRMGDVNIAAKALCLGMRDDKDTLKLAKELTKLNDERRNETDEISEKVAPSIEVENEQRIVAFDGSQWGKGLLGIIASKINDRFPDYPAFVYSEEDDGIFSGSVRCANEAIDCMDMFQQLKSERIIEMCAGHSRACVVKVRKDNLGKFLNAFSEIYDSMDIPDVVKKYDAVASLAWISNSFLEACNKIPFTAQEKPVFILPNVRVEEYMFMGKQQQHVKLFLRDASTENSPEAVCVNWWKMAGQYRELGMPRLVNIACSIQQDFMKADPCATLDIVRMAPVRPKTA